MLSLLRLREHHQGRLGHWITGVRATLLFPPVLSLQHFFSSWKVPASRMPRCESIGPWPDEAEPTGTSGHALGHGYRVDKCLAMMGREGEGQWEGGEVAWLGWPGSSASIFIRSILSNLGPCRMSTAGVPPSLRNEVGGMSGCRFEVLHQAASGVLDEPCTSYNCTTYIMYNTYIRVRHKLGSRMEFSYSYVRCLGS